jgi:hypothetical protein
MSCFIRDFCDSITDSRSAGVFQKQISPSGVTTKAASAVPSGPQRTCLHRGPIVASSFSSGELGKMRAACAVHDGLFYALRARKWNLMCVTK